MTVPVNVAPRLMMAPPRGCTLVELPPDTTSQRSGGGDDTVLSRRAGIAPSAPGIEPPLGGPLLLLLLRSLALLPAGKWREWTRHKHGRCAFDVHILG
jgi:hypothetical protein